MSHCNQCDILSASRGQGTTEVVTTVLPKNTVHRKTRSVVIPRTSLSHKVDWVDQGFDWTYKASYSTEITYAECERSPK